MSFRKVSAPNAMALELSDPSFYHLDTAFCPLPSGDVIYYPGAFSESGLRAIEERVAPGHRVAIDHEDATRFAANAVPLNSTIILSSCSERLRRRLEECGFAVIATPLHAFLRSGGSACCLTLRLDHRSSRQGNRVGLKADFQSLSCQDLTSWGPWGSAVC